MLGWIWIICLYVLVLAVFRWLGGVGAAGDAIERWGRTTVERSSRRTASSSS